MLIEQYMKKNPLHRQFCRQRTADIVNDEKGRRRQDYTEKEGLPCFSVCQANLMLQAHEK